MAISAIILNESPTRLWGLSSRERLERMLAKAGISEIKEDVQSIAAADSVLLLRGDYLYDQRIIENMAGSVGIVVETGLSRGRQPVAAHVARADADVMMTILSTDGPHSLPAGVQRTTPATLVSAYLKNLRKFELPYLLPITERNRQHLEQRLFDGSYKGVTDLVTKWLWPKPAQWATGFCARRGIVPNHVTSLSLILSVLAGILFFQGHYAWGLLPAWFMTFLDTVDGKLARVTLNYSTFGNLFDHAIDLIFPPIWYLAWAMSLKDLPAISLPASIWLFMGGYIAGRLVEVVFKQCLESSGIFCWQPVDSCFRLITGRRNPNLILLTLCLPLGRPDLGYLAVCLWTALSSLFLVLRLFMGVYTRIVSGPLQSWFLEVNPESEDLSACQRWFCPRPKTANDDDA